MTAVLGLLQSQCRLDERDISCLAALTPHQIADLVQDCIHGRFVLRSCDNSQAVQAAVKPALQSTQLAELLHSCVELAQTGLGVLLVGGRCSLQLL